MSFYNKLKIINDPLYGFINIPHPLIFDLIEHPYFQRLRRIKQLGTTSFVYPGALHNRFHHALGAMHLTKTAIDVLRTKGIEITEEEEVGVIAAILLHDIGHGPFSHALEHTIVNNVSHEEISLLMMQKMNSDFEGKLNTCIEIFTDLYPKKFLHQLISSQLDMDRLDYLKRDSFFTGVSEGVISTERIIKMLNVVNDELVVDVKGIYSIEKFLIARRLMYWQVYMHKTVVSAETILVNTLKRARYLAINRKEQLFASPAFHFFLYGNYTKNNFENNPETLEMFSKLDDYDIFTSIKIWENHPDKILSFLSNALVNRRLFSLQIENKKIIKEMELEIKARIKSTYHISDDELVYFFTSGELTNKAYSLEKENINILFKDGCLRDIADASDQLNIQMLAKPVKKYFVCYPKFQS
jgi:HD superfamily phosphohydrolase